MLATFEIYDAAKALYKTPGYLPFKYEKLDRCGDRAKTYESRAILRALSKALLVTAKTAKPEWS